MKRSLFAEVSSRMQRLPRWVRQNVTVSPKDGVLYESAGEAPTGHGRELVEHEPHKALLLSSLRVSPFGSERYSLMLDLDVAARLVPSSTEGHHHLFIDVDLSRAEHDQVMRALAAAGVIQPGYAQSALSTKYGATLRLPWVRKGQDKTLKQIRKDAEAGRDEIANVFDLLALDPC